MGLFDRFRAFINRFRRHAFSRRSLPEDAHANATRLPDGGDDSPPEWLRIVPIGDFPEHHNAAHEVTAGDVDDMVANFERRSTDLLVDFDHASVFDGDTRAAAWISEVEAREDGLYGRISDWTLAGKEAFANRDYRYLSPVYFLESEDKQGQEAGAWVHSVAITNLPYFDEGEVDPIGNRAQGDTQPDDSPTEDTTDFMDREELIERLGLDEDATDEEIEQAIDAQAQARADAEAEADAAEEEGEGEGDEPEAGAEAGEAGAEEEEDLEAVVSSIVDQRLAERDVEDRAEQLVTRAISDQKILPAQKDIYLNSARADFEGTKEQLGQIDEGAARPKGVKVNAGGSRPAPASKLFEYVQGQA